MYLVSKEYNRKCRRSSDLRKLTYAAGRRRTVDKSVSDKLHLTKVSGAKKNGIKSSFSLKESIIHVHVLLKKYKEAALD